MSANVSVVSERDVAFQLLEYLKIFENNGYDCANIVVLDSSYKIDALDSKIEKQNLQNLLNTLPLYGNTGIGNANWLSNANNTRKVNLDVVDDEIILVLNGIIENKDDLSLFLFSKGYNLYYDNDAELIGSILYYYLKSGLDFLSAIRASETKIKGSFAMGIMRCSEPGRLIALQQGCAVIIGLCSNENLLASDPSVLLDFVNQFTYLVEGDMADIRQNGVIIYDKSNDRVRRVVYEADLNNHRLSTLSIPEKISLNS